ncbi:MAG: protein kinase [Myxococcales bacterium]|nr:protein kinase [Myxococcales bacterium]
MDIVGTTLSGRYRIVRRLESGGMGVVYEALQEGLGRRVAVKTLHAHLATDETSLERFKREATQVAGLGHPNIVQITDFVAEPGHAPFYVMEYLEGQSLRDLVAQNLRLPPERVAHIGMQILSALAAAHAAGLVHRDIKPGNVFVTPIAGGADLVKLLDFGVAKVVRDGPPSSFQSDVRHVVGTVSYMAPEQLLGESIDGRADLYSLGATLHHAIAGRRPFDDATSPVELTRAICRTPPPRLEDEVRGIDRALAAVIARALAKSPGDRFESADAMAAALRPFSRAVPAPGESGRITIEIRDPAIPSAARPTQPPSTLPLPQRFSSAPPTEPAPAPPTQDAPTLPEGRPVSLASTLPLVSSQTAPIPLVNLPVSDPIPLVPTIDATLAASEPGGGAASGPREVSFEDGTLRSHGNVAELVAKAREARRGKELDSTVRVQDRREKPAPSALFGVAIALFVVALVLGGAAIYVGTR